MRLKSLLVVALTLLALLTSRADEPNAIEIKPSGQLPPKQTEQNALPLGKTLRLDFKLASSDDSQSYSVFCAERDYSLYYDRSKNGDSASLKITGKVAATSEKDRFLVHFQFAIDRDDEEGKGTITSSGSSLVTLGKAKKLVVFPGYSLELTVTSDD